MVPDADSATGGFFVESADSFLALAFLVPRTGKGGEDKLPAGSLSMFPAGGSELPTPSGRGLVLCITVSRLAVILGLDAETLPERVKRLLRCDAGGTESIQVPLTPEQVLAGNELIHCVYEGAVCNMFFKNKVLELLALFFGQVAMQDEVGDAVRFSLKDQEVIARAREFLLSYMGDPPGVSRIARHVGVNDTKLKRLFKDAYGQSPHTYLRGERMAAAKEMMIAKGLNVSQAAANVVYSNVSYFISAFTRHYGVRSGEVRGRVGSNSISCRCDPSGATTKHSSRFLSRESMDQGKNHCLEDTLHVCPRSAHGIALGVVLRREWEYVSLFARGVSDTRTKIRMIYDLESIPACGYCTPPEELQNIPAAEQMPCNEYPEP
jgi:AraC-like DNA-binding protein